MKTHRRLAALLLTCVAGAVPALLTMQPANAAGPAAVAQDSQPGPTVNRDVRRTPAVVPAALKLSPGCSDTTLPIVCGITEPVVTQQVTVYPLSFLPGDHVQVLAGGCVQTGGHGKTWKRYVNPAPNNGLYRGTISIPGVTTGVIPVSAANNGTFVVGGRGGSLILGYDDDNYSDNGYYARNTDNGTEDQCLNLGNAYVTLVIT
jgi:hypothetical protein